MLMMSLLMIWLLRLDPAIATVTCNYDDCLNNQSSVLSCTEFDSWSEVNEEFISTDCVNPPDPIYLKPSEPILLTSELNISLVAYANPAVQTYNQLDMYGLSGVNVYPWPACSGCVKKNLILYLSTVQFYVNNTPPSGYICSPDIIPDDTSTTVSFLSAYLASITINHGNTFGSSSQAVCPYLFKNVKFESIELYNQVDSFLYVSLLRFETHNTVDNPSQASSSVYSTISNLEVDSGFNYKLDSGLLHPLVFEKLTFLYCSGVIKSLQTDLFKQFKLLNTIVFIFNSMGNFYHQFGIKWMNYLNIESRINISLSSLKIPYTYPDQDFCIFSDFPLNGNIKLVLDYPAPNVSLTYIWLCTYGGMNSPCSKNWSINNSKLDAMLKLCKIKRNETAADQQQTSYQSYSEYYQIRIIDMLFIELVPFVLIPCVCLIGLFFNWKIIQTVRNNKKKDLKEDFYKYMSANAKFNCLYCLIFVFYPMTSCPWRQSYIFCSSIFTTQFVQFYKIVMMAYFGEVIKMCANISYLMMTANRYLLIGKDHAEWLVAIAKLKFKWVIRGSFVISALVNIGHGWEYQAVEDTAVTLSDVSNYGQINDFSYSDYPFASQGLPYFIYSILYFIIKFGVFFIVNTTLEETCGQLYFRAPLILAGVNWLITCLVYLVL